MTESPQQTSDPAGSDDVWYFDNIQLLEQEEDDLPSIPDWPTLLK